ncbi:BNR-4 repeat-containing protein [Halocatena marina]|nr:BNR-4 repeat-containing protein [Halocatena marina]
MTRRCSAHKPRLDTTPLVKTDLPGPPTLTIDKGGTLYVFYGCHNTVIRYAQSSNPYETSEWDDMSGLTSVPVGAYPSPVTYDGDIYVLYRTGDTHKNSYPAHEHGTIIRSTDQRDTWTDLGPVIDTSGHPSSGNDACVFDFDEHNGKLHMSWVIARGDPHGLPRAHAFHAYFDPDDESVYGVDGTEFGSTITWDEMSDSVVQAFQGQNVNNTKHAFKDDTVYVSFTHHNPDTNLVEWRLATWDGSEWDVEQVGDAVTKALTNNGQVRINDTGNREVHPIAHGGEVDENEEVPVEPRGGNVEVYTRQDGNWTHRLVAPTTNFTTWGRLSLVRDGPDEFPALFCEKSSSFAIPNIRLFAKGAVGQNATALKASLQTGYTPPLDLTREKGDHEGAVQVHDGSGDDNAYGPAVRNGEA